MGLGGAARSAVRPVPVGWGRRPQVSDLAAKIRQKVQPRALPAEFHDDVLRLQAAVMDALDEHEHVFLDAYFRETSDMGDAKYGRCTTCGNVTKPAMWCPTVRAVASALGVSEDPEEG